MIACILLGIIYTCNTPSHIRMHVYVCSILDIYKCCVCSHWPYGLLDFKIKLSIMLYIISSLIHTYYFAHMICPCKTSSAIVINEEKRKINL